MNQDSYNSNSLGFDQPQPPQSPVIHQPPQELSIQEMEDLKQQYLDELKHLSNLRYRDEIKIAELMENFNGMSIEIRKKEKLLQQEQWAYLSTHLSKGLHSLCFDDDDDEDYTSAITPNEPPDNSLSMGDEHLDTIPATESDEFIKSGVEDLISILSKSEGIPDHMCDVPSHDNSPPLDVLKDQIEDFSESNEEFSSIDDDYFSSDDIDYVEASPPNSELVSSEVMEIVIPEVRGIEASNDNPIPFYDPIISRTPLNLTLSGEKVMEIVIPEVRGIEASNDNPILFYDPIISGTPLNLTLSGESDFFLEGDMLLFEAFLNDDHSSDFKTKSSSTSLNSILEETHTFDNSLPEFTTFSKVLFDAEYQSNSSDDQSCSDEDVLEKIVSKPLCEEEIILIKIDQHPDNAEYDLMESLRTHDSSLPISSKIDSLLEEFAGELTLLKSIRQELMRLIVILRKTFVLSRNCCTITLLCVHRKNLFLQILMLIDLFCTLDYPMPPGIVDEDYDYERDILIPKDLPRNNTLSFAEKESFYFDI
nr:hypothetical protein [Tanacetum cinerariifolium]